jgi:hypothetical protein
MLILKKYFEYLKYRLLWVVLRIRVFSGNGVCRVMVGATDGGGDNDGSLIMLRIIALGVTLMVGGILVYRSNRRITKWVEDYKVGKDEPLDDPWLEKHRQIILAEYRRLILNEEEKDNEDLVGDVTGSTVERDPFKECIREIIERMSE